MKEDTSKKIVYIITIILVILSSVFFYNEYNEQIEEVRIISWRQNNARIHPKTYMVQVYIVSSDQYLYLMCDDKIFKTLDKEQISTITIKNNTIVK